MLGWGVAPMVGVLQYIEQGNLYNAYNVSLGVIGSTTGVPNFWLGNTTVFNTQIATFSCPSDTKEATGSVINYLGNLGGPFVLGGYSGTIIPTSYSWDYADAMDLVRTAKTIGFAAVTDGTSNTALYAEAVTGTNRPVTTGMGAQRGEAGCLHLQLQ